MHQHGVFDLYQMEPDARGIRFPDVNRPDRLAGCGSDYWGFDWACYLFPPEVADIMSAYEAELRLGVHTAGALNSNYRHRRGYYGEYLFDTPETTSVKIVDKRGNVLPYVGLRFYQKELQV